MSSISATRELFEKASLASSTPQSSVSSKKSFFPSTQTVFNRTKDEGFIAKDAGRSKQDGKGKNYLAYHLGTDIASNYDQTLLQFSQNAKLLVPSSEITSSQLEEQLQLVEASLEQLEDLYRSLCDLAEENDLAYASDEGYSNEEDDDSVAEDETVEDVQPIYGAAAMDLNEAVINQVKGILGGASDKLTEFKSNTLRFGTGRMHPEDFYIYLLQAIGPAFLDAVVPDFARLIGDKATRTSLLQTHARWTRQQILAANKATSDRNGPVLKTMAMGNAAGPLFKTLSSGYSTISAVSSANNPNEAILPSSIETKPINQLLFLIHGIGQHDDFQDDNWLSWDGSAGFEGGNFALRELFAKTIANHFREVEINLEIQSIEWHEELHGPTGVDEIHDLISTEGAAALREFTKTTIMDVLYYMSPGYGQIVVNTVTEQLNSKYRIFMEEHPGFTGAISFLSHSLGSVISYDILTHPRGTRSRNGIYFPGLDFEVDTLFAIGSPVPILVLSRGELQYKDGELAAGLPLPHVKNYFNINHPLDPIGYRVEPLIHPEMKTCPPVQLMQAKRVQNLSLVKLMELMQESTVPRNGMTRMDFYVRPRATEGMMEIVHALSSHSCYWESEDVALFVLLQLCNPVAQTLRQYTAAKLPPPKLLRREAALRPTTDVLGIDQVVLRSSATGLWKETTVLVDDRALHFLGHLTKLMCKKRSSIPLGSAEARLSDDNSLFFSIVTPGKVYEIKAFESRLAKEWVESINLAIVSTRPENIHLKKIHYLGLNRSVAPSSALTFDYFGCLKDGMLSIKGKSSGWTSDLSWRNRWAALHRDRIDFFETQPVFDFVGQRAVDGCQVLSYSSSLLFRVLTPYGAATEFRVKDRDTFDLWLRLFQDMLKANVIQKADVANKSQFMLQSVVTNSTPQSKSKSVLRNASLGSYKIAIQGHQIKSDEADKEYVAFVIHTKSDKGTFLVHRRYNEFKALHQALHQTFTNDMLPALPHTRLWNRFDPEYLKQKGVQMQAYLVNLSRLCENNDGSQTLIAFLSRQDANFSA